VNRWLKKKKFVFHSGNTTEIVGRVLRSCFLSFINFLLFFLSFFFSIISCMTMTHKKKKRKNLNEPEGTPKCSKITSECRRQKWEGKLASNHTSARIARHRMDASEKNNRVWDGHLHFSSQTKFRYEICRGDNWALVKWQSHDFCLMISWFPNQNKFLTSKK
jgi:hypothetical protein